MKLSSIKNQRWQTTKNVKSRKRTKTRNYMELEKKRKLRYSGRKGATEIIKAQHEDETDREKYKQHDC